MSLQYLKILIGMEQFRKTPRARFLDYDRGDYFVTICTKNRRCYFGNIHNSQMILSEIGAFLESQLNSASDYCENIYVPLFVVMPNHVHIIVSITGDVSIDCCNDYEQRSPNPCLRGNSTCQRHVPTLSRYISSLKGSVTRFARSRDIEFGWQPRYHDHFIRGEKDCNNISAYILNNVAGWSDDCFFSE